MTFADSNRASLRYIPEVSSTWGVMPLSGNTREARITGTSLAASKETVVSNELRADRMVSDVVEVSAASSGDVNWELSAGAFDDFMQAFLLGLWSRPMSFDFFRGNVSWTSTSQLTITGGDFTAYPMLAVGRIFKTAGFSTATNNGYFAVLTTAFSGGNTQINVAATPGTIEVAGPAKVLYDANDRFLASTALRAGTSSASTFDSNSGNAFAAAIAAGQLVVGQKIRVSGFATANSNGLFTVTSTSDDVIGVTPAPATDANAGADTINVRGSHLRNPGDIDDITPQSFTLQTHFTDIDEFLLQKGMRVGSFNMEAAAGAIVTGTFGFSGKDTTNPSADVLGDVSDYTVLPSVAFDVMNATSNVGSIIKDGTALGSALQSISLSGDSSLRMQNAVGSKFPRGIGTGRFNLTGTVNAYFEDMDLWNDFINHTTTALSWDFTDADGNNYVFTLPAVKFTSDAPAPAGIDQDIFEELAFVAFRDPTTNTQFTIDRFSPA